MSYTGLSRAIAVPFLLSSLVAAAQQSPPHILRDPVIGLKYDTDSVKFDPLPADVLAKCTTMADDQNVHSKMWIYALTHDDGRTYYVVAGYSVYTHPHPLEHSRYVILDLGTVFAIEGDECVIFGEARETFDARYFEETPQRVLLALANDLASRLASGFGGPDRLSTELRRQRIPLASLSPELNEAFAPYFRKTIRPSHNENGALTKTGPSGTAQRFAGCPGGRSGSESPCP